MPLPRTPATWSPETTAAVTAMLDIAEAGQALKAQGLATPDIRILHDVVMVTGPYNARFAFNAKKDGAKWNGASWLYPIERERRARQLVSACYVTA